MPTKPPYSLGKLIDWKLERFRKYLLGMAYLLSLLVREIN